MSCDSEKSHSHVNKKRLALLLGLLAMVAVVAVGSILVSPALAAIIPLLFVFAACPAMCTVNRIGSWLKGGVGAGTKAAVPSLVDKGLEQSKHAPEIQQEQRKQGKVAQ